MGTLNDGEVRARVDALRRAGRYEEAAALLLASGEPGLASELLATIWKFDRAIQVAEEAGILHLAYRHALAAQNRTAAARLLVSLKEDPDQATEAANHAEAKERWRDAANLREAAGDTAAAAVLYEQADDLFDAARLCEGDGRYREAGVLYERTLRRSPDDAEAALRLGRILAYFGRYGPAVRALQTAEQDAQRRIAAIRLMVACLAGMGLEKAAATRLDELRRTDPELPVTVPEFLERVYGDERGLLSLAHEEEDRLLAGRYRIVRTLGAGSTGRVVLAYDSFYDREIAIKVLTVGAGNVGRDAYVRFAREARVAAGLNHPNIVRMFEYNPDGPFLVMEHMSGGTLEERFEELDHVPPSVTEHVVRSVLRGLEAVHRRGVVHRDLKPANVFFGAAGDVKIGDFGVAHLADLGTTLTGAMLGTLAYMAPEQITGSQKPTASTDLYAVGVLLFRMLTGRLPFPGPDFVTQHLERRPPLPSEIDPRLLPYDEIARALLTKNPLERPQLAAEVREAIESLPWDQLAGPRPRKSTPEMTESEAPRDSSFPGPEERYSILEALERGASLARDEVLLRLVRIEPCDPARASRLRSLSRADTPYLQAIYEIDEDQHRAIIERPQGVLLSELDVTDAERERIRNQVHRALSAIHEVGLAHGNVRADRVRVGEGRAVLLLPLDPECDGLPSADRDAASRL